MSDFVALDVETANYDLASICQIGIVTFRDGRIADRWQTLVDPEDYFDEINTSIHGITEQMVSDAPTFPEIEAALRAKLTDQIVAHHTHFDRVSISYCLEDYDLLPVNCTWLDTARVTRRTWPQFSKSGYGLSDVAGFLRIEFQHHNALEDARAAGEILLHAIQQSGLSPQQWLNRVEKPVDLTSTVIAREGNPSGPLYGEMLVFTGALTAPRKQSAQIAAEAGCTVEDGVTKHTTILVVGDQHAWKLAGYEKSKKHRKAEELIARGQSIRILSENDFIRMMRTESP